MSSSSLTDFVCSDSVLGGFIAAVAVVVVVEEIMPRSSASGGNRGFIEVNGSEVAVEDEDNTEAEGGIIAVVVLSLSSRNLPNANGERTSMSISMISKADDDGTTEEGDSCSSFETSAAGASNPSRDVAAEGEARVESSILIASSKADSRLSMLVSQFPDEFFFKKKQEKKEIKLKREDRG